MAQQVADLAGEGFLVGHGVGQRRQLGRDALVQPLAPGGHQLLLRRVGSNPSSRSRA